MIKYIIIYLVFSCSAFGADFSKFHWKTKDFEINAEIHISTQVVSPGIWIKYSGLGIDGKKEEFTATSIKEKIDQSDFKLIAAPQIRVGKSNSYVFDSYTKKNEWDGNHGFAVIFNYLYNPIEVPDQFVTEVENILPQSIIRFPREDVLHAGKPWYIKALLTRITWSKVYPIGVFDIEEIKK